MVLQDQVVFVTGASRGFGEAATLELVQRGHRVVATMRNPDRDGPGLLAGAGARSDRITVTSCDVTDRASVDAAVALAERTYGRIDAVFNNAGYGLYGPIEELQDDEVLRQLDTNVVGQIRVVRAALPGMRARGQRQDRQRVIAGRAHLRPHDRPLLSLQARRRGDVGGVAVRGPGVRASRSRFWSPGCTRRTGRPRRWT